MARRRRVTGRAGWRAFFRQSTRCLEFEPLEERRLLAVNVYYTLSAWEAAVGGISTETLNSVTSSESTQGTSVTVNAYTFDGTSNQGSQIQAGPTSGTTIDGTTQLALGGSNSGGTANMAISLASSLGNVYGFGFEFNDSGIRSDGNSRTVLYNGQYYGFSPSGTTNQVQFFGLVDTGGNITSYTVNWWPNFAEVALDNFVTATEIAPALTNPTAAYGDNSATLGATVAMDGGSPVTTRGILYAPTATNGSPTLGGNGVVELDDAAGGTGTFAENATGLTANTSYSFVGFATNGAGTGYTSPVSTFTTLVPTLASSDSGGNWTITDTAGVNNQLSLSSTGGNVVITDAAQAFLPPAAGGVLSNNDHTLSLPTGLVSGLSFNLGGGSDTFNDQGLTGTFSGGLTINQGPGSAAVSFSGCTALGNGALSVSAASITVSAPLDTGGANATLTATESISIAGNASTDGGNLTLTAGGIAVNSPMDTGGANATLTARGSISIAGNVSTDGGNLTLAADSGALGSGSLSTAANTSLSTAGGSVSITAAAIGLLGTVNAGGGQVTMAPSVPGAAIRLANSTPGFAATAGSTLADAVKFTAVDAAGDVYVAGTMNGTAAPTDFAGNPVTGYGGSNVFVAKLSPSGTQDWFQLSGSTGSDALAGLALDSSGNVILVGTEIAGDTPRDFNRNAVTGHGTTNSDIFVAKLNGSNGAQAWFDLTGSTSTNTIPDLVLDSGGSVYVAGTETGTSTPRDFNGNTVTGYGSNSPFVAKLNGSNGSQAWFHLTGGTGGSNGIGNLAVDASGNVVVTGTEFGSSLTRDFNGNLVTGRGAADVFVAKFNGSSGAQQWYKLTGSTSTDTITALTLDTAGNIYVGGTETGTATPRDFNGNTVAGYGGPDIFVAMLNGSGVQQWFKLTGSASTDAVNSLAVDSSGNVDVAGTEFGIAAPHDFNGTAVTGYGAANVFAAQLNNSGVQQWFHLAGSTSTDTIKTMLIDGSGDMYLIGTIKGGASPKDFTGTALPAYGDLYLAKLNANGTQQYFDVAGNAATGIDTVTALALDAAGNAYVTGSITGSAAQPPNDFTGNPVGVSGATTDVYAARLNASGAQVWFDVTGGNGSNTPATLNLDRSGNVIVSGTYSGTANFAPSPGIDNHTSYGSANPFVWKINNASLLTSGLPLSNALLEQITAGALTIGNAASGPITVEIAVTLPTATNVNLTSGGSIGFTSGSFNTGGGPLTLSPGSSASVGAPNAGVDAVVGNTLATGLAFANGATLGLAVNGNTADTQYDQLNVTGLVNLSGATLSLGGNYTPAGGDVFTVVSAGNIAGQFAGLAQGSYVTFNGVSLVVNYTSTAVTLTDVVAYATTTTVSSSFPSGSTYGQDVFFTATVSSAGGTPTGSVQFVIDGADAGSPITLVGGNASYDTATLSATSHTIAADYTSDNGNYISGSSANIAQQVSPANLTITANSTSKTYGQALALGNTAFTANGLVGGDSISSITLSSAGAANTAGVAGSPYPIVPSAASGSGLSNYNISYANGSLIVNPAPLTITADNLNKTYGAAVPTLTFTPSGFVNGDTANVLSGSPSLSTAANSTSPVGNYPINIGPGTLSAQNYTFSFANGTLSVAYSTVAGRDLFYANSIYNGNTDTASSADDNAIDTGKTALLPGQTATYANYTDSTQGINGIMVDINGLANPASLTAADFQFLVGNDSTPGDWTSLTVAPTVAVRVGAGTGGSDRVELIWPDNTIHNGWLQVTVLADTNTGLAAPDVFYFGSEPGAVLGNGYTSFDDIFAVYRAILAASTTATASTATDVNHDGTITFDDIFAVYRAILDNDGFFLNMLTAPAAPATMATPASAGTGTAPASVIASAAAPLAAEVSPNAGLSSDAAAGDLSTAATAGSTAAVVAAQTSKPAVGVGLATVVAVPEPARPVVIVPPPVAPAPPQVSTSVLVPTVSPAMFSAAMPLAAAGPVSQLGPAAPASTPATAAAGQDARPPMLLPPAPAVDPRTNYWAVDLALAHMAQWMDGLDDDSLEIGSG